MNINHLRFVKAVSECNNFSEAARFCNVTQPTLSNGVSKLEEELGEKIFDRNTRSVKLTTFGSKILSSISSILELEESIYLYSKDFSNPKTVVVKIGLSPLLNTKFVSMLTKTFTENNKNQKIILIEQDMETLQDKYEQGEIDIIFIPKLKKGKVTNFLHLYDEALVYLDNNEVRNEIEISDLKNKTFLMVPDTCGLSEIVRSLVGTSRKSIKEYEGKAMSYQVLADWAVNGLGCAILPKSKIPYGIKSTPLVTRNIATNVTFIAKWRPQDLNRLRLLIQHFKQNSKDIYKGLKS